MKKPTKTNKRSSKLLYVALILFLMVTGLYVFNLVSPWPSALLIRGIFELGGLKTSAALEKYVPADIGEVKNIQYRTGDNDAYLDVYYPESAVVDLPTIVWIHGGAWISGDKENVANYLKILASHGYVTVGVNYSIAPEKHYPVPIVQVNEALGYLSKNAERFYIDKNMMVLAGDSAGSQIAAQMAALVTNKSYAAEMGIVPSVKVDQLKATLLNCGVYELGILNFSGVSGWFLTTVGWSYSGQKDFVKDKFFHTVSVAEYVNSNFPPSFITVGNADPLEPQSYYLAKILRDKGVAVDTLFYPVNHVPALGHEYQFDLDSTDGENALDQMLEFLQTALQKS